MFGDFPNVLNQAAVADYYFNQKELGAVYFEVVVDGVATSLGRSYAVGAETPPLPDGGGTRYTVVGAFLTPLTKGNHTVTIRALLTGDALLPFGGPFEFEATYDVIVR